MGKAWQRIDEGIRGVWSNRCNVCGKKKDPQAMMTVNECVECFAESIPNDKDIGAEVLALDGLPLSSAPLNPGRSSLYT
jgi:hypothetical protein